MHHAETLEFDTSKFRVIKERGIINLNQYIIKAVEKSGIRNGQVTIQSEHTTASLIGQEDELGFLQDMAELLDRLVPKRKNYNHDDFSKRYPRVEPGERKNGKAHLESLLVGHLSMTFPIRNYKINLGDWPSVLLVDFDLPSRKPRRIQISVISE